MATEKQNVGDIDMKEIYLVITVVFYSAIIFTVGTVYGTMVAERNTKRIVDAINSKMHNIGFRDCEEKRQEIA